jgi:hypothetical protein
MPGVSGEPGSWWQRLGWLVLIWAGSVAALAVVSLLIRWWLK